MPKNAEKARYYVCVCYPDNMIESWEINIGDLLQLPYCYCVHDKDTTSDIQENRKTHVHIMIAFTNTTTSATAERVFMRLSAPGKKCFAACFPVQNVRHMYNYLIHDTETCKKKHKHLYSPKERVCGNNFDIGNYEQISLTDKYKMVKELCSYVRDNGIYNYIDLFDYVISLDDSALFETFTQHTALFRAMCDGMFQKLTRNGHFKHLDGK